MIHNFQRGAGETADLAVERARESHRAIGGLDARAYLEMTRREPYGSGFRPYPALVSRVASLLGEQSPLVADLGCGPGNLARLLLDADTTLRVACVDLSSDMLEVAGSELDSHAADARFQLLQEDLQRPLSLSDVVIAVFKGTAHHISDLDGALRNIRAALAHRSVLLLHDFRRNGDLRTVLPFVESLLELPDDDFAICTRILGYVDSRRVSYTASELISATRRAGLSLVTALVSPDEVVTVGASALTVREHRQIAQAVGEAFRGLGFEPLKETIHEQESVGLDTGAGSLSSARSTCLVRS